MAVHPLLDTPVFDGEIEAYLASIGEIFVAHRGHDSHNTSFGVRVDGRPWFVKFTRHPEAITYLESAQRFHTAVQHPAIVPLASSSRGDDGLAIVLEWVDGQVLSDMHAHPRDHPESAYSRFRALPIGEIVAAINAIVDAHLAVASHGFVAVDFYDGAVIYDFARRQVRLCDLDAYCPGPYTLNRDRQYGSTRFMAPEEFQRGALIDERTTVFTLGRTAFVFLSDGLRGEPEQRRWRANAALYDVAWCATQPDPAQRYQSVAAFARAWRNAAADHSA